MEEIYIVITSGESGQSTLATFGNEKTARAYVENLIEGHKIITGSNRVYVDDHKYEMLSVPFLLLGKNAEVIAQYTTYNADTEERMERYIIKSKILG